MLGGLCGPQCADGLIDGRGGPDDDVAVGDVGAGRADRRLADLPVDEPAHWVIIKFIGNKGRGRRNHLALRVRLGVKV